MNHNDLKKRLKQLPEAVERQPDCPDDYQLASYMDGGLSERDHGEFEVHVADCPFCIERVGIIGRAGESGSTLEQARQDQANPTKRSHWQHAPRWAAAALVVITVGFVVNLQSPGQLPDVTDEPANPEYVSERLVKALSPFPQLLSPLEGNAVDPKGFVFKWQEVPGSLFYDIRIVSDDGGLIIRQRVWDTNWSLPEETYLQSGSEYFVRVDAFVSESKAVSSEHISFRVSGGQQ
jgi:hypothetical protein